MFDGITRFLLDTIFPFFDVALLLRAWTQAVRLSPRNPLSQAIFQLTGWLMHPLRRVIPAMGYIDWSSPVAAYVTVLVYLLLLVTSVSASPMTLVPMGFVAALFTVLRWAFNVLIWVTIASAVLSQMGPVSPMGAVFNTLVDPPLRPIRRVVPPLSGRLDLSPLILLVIAQVIVIALSHLSLSPLLMRARHALYSTGRHVGRCIWPATQEDIMNAWKAAPVYVLVMLAPTLTACTAGGAVTGGVAGHEITHSTAGTIGGAATGTAIGHELSK